jgi:hypothetical protein
MPLEDIRPLEGLCCRSTPARTKIAHKRAFKVG